MRNTAFVLFLICCTLLVPNVCRAQNSAAVTGKVVDSSGAAIANAVVTLTNLTTGSASHSTTGNDGQFVFSAVAQGPEIIAIQKSGFESFSERVAVFSRATHQHHSHPARSEPGRERGGSRHGEP